MTRLTQLYIDKIQNLLQQIEKDKDIKIIFAIENGSRSWGMASKDSDYDVRFVFYRSVKNYISLSQEKDVITAAYDKDLQPCNVQGSLIDISGFDIFKYLKLLLTSNPTTIEWLCSPIVYYGNNNLPLREYMRNNFNQERLFKHYFSLFRNNYREFIQQAKAITYKKYLYSMRGLLNAKYVYEFDIYSMRGLLNAKYVYEFDRIPPLDLRQTVKELENIVPVEVYKRIQEVIEIKSQGLERDVILRIPEFDEFFNVELQNEYSNFNSRKPDVEVFNNFLRKQIIHPYLT